MIQKEPANKYILNLIENYFYNQQNQAKTNYLNLSVLICSFVQFLICNL